MSVWIPAFAGNAIKLRILTLTPSPRNRGSGCSIFLRKSKVFIRGNRLKRLDTRLNRVRRKTAKKTYSKKITPTLHFGKEQDSEL
jgi:hypothetical protein